MNEDQKVTTWLLDLPGRLETVSEPGPVLFLKMHLAGTRLFDLIV